MLERYLMQLSSDLGIDLPPIKAGAATLKLNPELAITFRELDPGYFLYAPVTLCPKVKREELFTLLMKANFLGQGTGGGVLGLDEQEKFLTLSLSLPYDMNYKSFKDMLSDFANYVDYWKDEVKRIIAE